jgi:hypothetical protein
MATDLIQRRVRKAAGGERRSRPRISIGEAGSLPGWFRRWSTRKIPRLREWRAAPGGRWMTLRNKMGDRSMNTERSLRHLRHALFAATLGFTLETSYAGQLEDGVHAWGQGDFASAMSLLAPLAEEEGQPRA